MGGRVQNSIGLNMGAMLDISDKDLGLLPNRDSNSFDN